MYMPDDLNLLEKLQEATTNEVDEEKGSFKNGDTVTYNMLGGGLTDSDLMRTLGTAEHILRVDHDGAKAEIVETIGEVVSRYSIVFEDGFAIANLAPSELKPVKEDTRRGLANDVASVLSGSGTPVDLDELGDYLVQLNTDDYNALEQAVKLGNKDEIIQIMKSVGFTESKTNEAKNVVGVQVVQVTQNRWDAVLQDEYSKDDSVKQFDDVDDARKKAKDLANVFDVPYNGVKYLKKEESKTNEAEDATDTMKPQEKPNLKAEDCNMEDLSDVDLEKAKGSSEESGNAIRSVDDKELVVEPDKVVTPKKESVEEGKKFGVFGNHRDTNKYHSSYYDTEDDAVKAAKDLEATHYVEAWAADERGQFDNLDQIIWKSKFLKKEAKVEEETEFTPSRVEMKNVSDDQLTKLHKNARRSAEYWTKDRSAPEKVRAAKDAMARYEEELVKRGLLTGVEVPESKYSFMKNREPLWLCDECHKTFRSNESVCTLCESTKTEKISEQTAGFTKEVFQVTWKNTDTGEEELTRVMAFDKADAKREAKRSNREITKVEGPITEESKEESKVPFDGSPEGAELEEEKGMIRFASKTTEYGSDSWKDFNEELKKRGIVPLARSPRPLDIESSAFLVKNKDKDKFKALSDQYNVGFEIAESKLKEGVHELVGNVPGINPEEQAILRKAIEDGSISNEWPSEEQIVDTLVTAQVDPAIVDDADMGELRQIYLKHILLTKAMKMTKVASESEVPKKIEPITVIEIVRSKIDPEAYNIRVVELPEGDDIVILDSVSGRTEALNRGKEFARVLNAKFLGIIDEKKVNEEKCPKCGSENFAEGNEAGDYMCAECGYDESVDESKLKEDNIFQLSDEELEKLPVHELGRARETAWTNYRLGSGSKGGDDWAKAWRRLDRIVKKKMGESKLKEQEEDTFHILAKSFTDREDADKLAKEKEGQVIQDEEDETKFAVVVRNAQ